MSVGRELGRTEEMMGTVRPIASAVQHGGYMQVDVDIRMEDIVLLQEEDEEAQAALRRAAGLGGEDSEEEEDDVFQLDELNLADQNNTDPAPRKYGPSRSRPLARTACMR
jgi:hypothetical protein